MLISFSHSLVIFIKCYQSGHWRIFFIIVLWKLTKLTLPRANSKNQKCPLAGSDCSEDASLYKWACKTWIMNTRWILPHRFIITLVHMYYSFQIGKPCSSPYGFEWFFDISSNLLVGSASFSDTCHLTTLSPPCGGPTRSAVIDHETWKTHTPFLFW